MGNGRTITLQKRSTTNHFSYCVVCVLVFMLIGLLGTYLYTTFISQNIHQSTSSNFRVRGVVNRTFTRRPLKKANRLSDKRIGTSSKQYAFVACSIHSSKQAYCFYTPLIALAWNRLGYQLIVIFVGDFLSLKEKRPGYIRLADKYVTQYGGLTMDFQCSKDQSIHIAQTIRIFIGFLPLPFLTDDDFLITTDADLIPLRREQYMLREGYPDGFVVNRFCCGLFKHRNRTYEMFPMGHIYLRRRTWRAMILESVPHKELTEIERKRGQHPPKSYEDQLSRNYSNRLGLLLFNEQRSVSIETMILYLNHEFQGIGWDTDQLFVTTLLTDYRNTTTDGQKLLIDERSLLLRLDREQPLSEWAKVQDYSKFGDAHCTHTIFQDNFWPVILQLFKSIFNTTIVQSLHEYATAYQLLSLDWL